jgi:CheY-like chemotaxis protein
MVHSISTMLVLYAEDDIEDYSLFLEVLEFIQPGAECMNVINGVEVLKFLDDCVILPDYIFLDINMPAMDGKACLKAIKRDPRYKNIPVVIYTTSRNPLDQEFSTELGVLAYLPKPNTIDEAKAALQKIFVP